MKPYLLQLIVLMRKYPLVGLFLLVCLVLFIHSCSGDYLKSSTGGVVDTRVNGESPPTSLGSNKVIGDSQIIESQKVTFQTCISLGAKLMTLKISDAVLIAPQETELPENSDSIDIYEIVEYPIKKEELSGMPVCRAKLKTARGDYPIIFYLSSHEGTEHLVLESQGKRKWIFQWKLETQ